MLSSSLYAVSADTSSHSSSDRTGMVHGHILPSAGLAGGEFRGRRPPSYVVLTPRLCCRFQVIYGGA